jgi:hypothetical protein
LCFVGELSAPLERNAQCVELLLGPADAYAEDQPPAAEVGEIRGHARDQQRVPVGRDQHGGAQPDPPGEPGEPRQRGERLIERRRILLGDVRGDRDVVGDHQQIEAQALHGLRPVTQHAGIGAGAKVRDVHAEIHRTRLSRENLVLEGNDHGVERIWPWISRYVWPG